MGFSNLTFEFKVVHKCIYMYGKYVLWYRVIEHVAYALNPSFYLDKTQNCSTEENGITGTGIEILIPNKKQN